MAGQPAWKAGPPADEAGKRPAPSQEWAGLFYRSRVAKVLFATL